MITDSISLKNVNSFAKLDVEFVFPDSNIIVVTGKNGAGKTTIIKAFHLLSDPNIFAKSSGERVLREDSQVSFTIEGFPPFHFNYNPQFNALDTKDALPPEHTIVAELPIPYGARFEQFSKIAMVDSELRANIASTSYEGATDLINFLSIVYSSKKFGNLKSTKITNNDFYFLLKNEDYYIREDHFSSGEFFLIQLYRLINSGSKIILIDELDVALDAVAQVNLYSAIKPILRANNSRLIVISHSLAFMSTVDEGGLYYLEGDAEGASLDSRSFGYVKSDLFGFRGYDRYILTEDDVLEGFIEFLIRYCSINCHYRYITIGVAGCNQLQKIVEKNDREKIFSDPDNVLCVVDGDVHENLKGTYNGPTRILCSPVQDLELFIFKNRARLLPDVGIPPYRESNNEKKASKSYWKWLVNTMNRSPSELYRYVVESESEKTKSLAQNIRDFLGQ